MSNIKDISITVVIRLLSFSFFESSMWGWKIILKYPKKRRKINNNSRVVLRTIKSKTRKKLERRKGGDDLCQYNFSIKREKEITIINKQ